MSVLSDIMNDVGAELGRLGTQGTAELAAALFSNSDAYVQYGAGQQAAEAPSVEAPVVEQAIQEQSRGMEM